MSDIVIKVENLSKAYQIGQIGTGTISRDLERFWATKVLGKEDPFLKIGETNDRSTKGESDIVWSLKDINFDINQGDAIGIIGKNGAGKSTLLKLLSRVTSPTTGSIKVKGRISSLLEVGTGFHPELSGQENIYLNGAILGMRKKEITRKLDEIIDFSGVERYIDTPVKRYSSGMYVRLAFAVAAHLESEILIVDEVLAVGDAEFQKKCLGKMGDISKGEGRTVLFVSHNMAAVKTLCSSAILLENGKIEVNGNTNTCIDKYFKVSEVSNLRNGFYISDSVSQNPYISKVFNNKNDMPCVIFYHDQDIILEIDYCNFIPIVSFTIGIALLDADKNKLFTSHFDFFQSKEKEGRVRCKIPKDILNQGIFSFDVAIFQKGGMVFNYLESICEFELIDRGSELYYQVNDNIGPLRITCEWEIL